MGCGASTDKGRRESNPLNQQQIDTFFPPRDQISAEKNSPSPVVEALRASVAKKTDSHEKTADQNNKIVDNHSSSKTGALPAEPPSTSVIAPSSPLVKKNHHQQQTHQQQSPHKKREEEVKPSTTAGRQTPPVSPNKTPSKKKATYVPPPPIAAVKGNPVANNSNKNIPASSNNNTNQVEEEEEEEYHGELTYFDNPELDYSCITTDPDLRSEIPINSISSSPNNNNKKNSNNNTTKYLKMPEDKKEEEDPSEYEYPDDSPEPNSDSGMRFDELYRLKGVLGTGAFSTVREGFHRSNAEVSYAVKCINRKKLSEEDEAALLDEVSILKEMKHPHIIRLFDFFTEPSTYYLVMERMRGGELFDRIVAKAYYSEKEARDTCRIILRAVEYCHIHHVAHRDLKPENLLLLSDVDDSAVKIADFGFAKKVYEPNSLTTQCGTPGYVAPEILEGTAYDERADMWSVGVILYILLGGYPPFIESTQRDLFRKIRKGEYEFHEEYWGTVSADAKLLISSLLTVSASARLTATGALQNEWIMGDDAKLAGRDLASNLEKLRNFNAKRKFRAAVSTIMAVNKLNFMGKEFFTTLKGESDASSKDDPYLRPPRFSDNGNRSGDEEE